MSVFQVNRNKIKTKQRAPHQTIIFYMAQGTVNKIKTQPTDWEKIYIQTGDQQDHFHFQTITTAQTVQYQSTNSPTLKLGVELPGGPVVGSSLSNAVDAGSTLVQRKSLMPQSN